MPGFDVMLGFGRLQSNAKGLQWLTRPLIGLNMQKGYGFIQTDDGSTDAFVDIAAVERLGHWQSPRGAKALPTRWTGGSEAKLSPLPSKRSR